MDPGDVHDRIDQILEDAADQITRLDGDEESQEAATQELRVIGSRADDLVSDTDPKTLLGVVDSPEKVSEYESISLARAMAESDPESVAKLRTLLTLSKLPDDDDDEFSEHVDKIRELRSLSKDEGESAGEGTEESEDEGASTGHAETEPESDTEGEADETDDEPEAEDDATSDTEDTDEAAEDAEESTEDADEAVESDDADQASEPDDADPSDQLKAKLQEGIDDFRDGVQSYRASLKGDDADTASADSATETDEAESDSSSSDGSRVTSRRRAGTTFSTMPSRNRGDMGGVRRFSTIPHRRREEDE